MRRAAALFDRIVDPGNFLEAYFKARKGKRRRADVRRFSADLDRSLETFRAKLCNLRVSGYVRYMDDLVLWGDSTAALKMWEADIRSYCTERLLLELKTACYNRTNRGVPFLGFVLTPGRLVLSSRSIRRTGRKLGAVERLLSNNRIDQTDAGDRARALMARTYWTKE